MYGPTPADMRRKLILFSADALVGEDLLLLERQPAFREALGGGARVRRIRSIYPTLTYPCHASIITGTYPEVHAVTSNTLPEPGNPRPLWRWERLHNHCPQDLFTQAKAHGYTTASVFWPTTGGHPAVDWLIPEVWPYRPSDTLEAVMERMGSSREVVQLASRNWRGRRMDRHPEADEVLVRCACDLIREAEPDVLALHPVHVDEARHAHGVFHPEVTRAVLDTDRYIGWILEALEEKKLRDRTCFVLVSDHGQMDYCRILRPNVLLREAGLVRCDPEGRVTLWKAWCQGGGMCSPVVLSDPEDPALVRETLEVLTAMKEREDCGISRVYTREEARLEEHLYGDASFILEGDGQTAFSENWLPPAMMASPGLEEGERRATHGYHPDRGPQPVFVARGPGFREGAFLEEGNLVDEAPTLARVLGFSLPLAQGRPMSTLLE